MSKVTPVRGPRRDKRSCFVVDIFEEDSLAHVFQLRGRFLKLIDSFGLLVIQPWIVALLDRISLAMNVYFRRRFIVKTFETSVFLHLFLLFHAIAIPAFLNLDLLFFLWRLV